MHIQTGDYAYRLTGPRRVLLAAVILTIVAVPVTLLILALSAHRPEPPAPPAPTPIIVVNA